MMLSLLLFALLPSCAFARSYSPNKALIKLWEEVKADEPVPPPYLAVYRDEKKELRFIAAVHGSDAATFSLIRDAFSDPPEVLIVEGQSSEEGFSPQRMVERMDREALYGKAEPCYAANLALRNRVPFIGGEPSNAQSLDAILSAGFSVKDLEGYECLRGMIGGPGHVGNLEATFANMKESFENNYAIDDGSLLLKDEREFDAWCAKNYGASFLHGDLRRYQERRFLGPEGGLDQRMSDVMSKSRNAHMAQVIADMLNAHDKVLVVYGAGHRMELSAVLEDMLGKATFIRPDLPTAGEGRLPVTEKQIVAETFHGKKGKVLQSRQNQLDFFVKKRGPGFCVRRYRYAHLFEEKSFVGEACFKTVEEVNEHLAPSFR